MRLRSAPRAKARNGQRFLFAAAASAIQRAIGASAILVSGYGEVIALRRTR